jgi:hypothetical protein
MKTYRFGKHAPKIDYRTLKLGHYLTESLPHPPPSFDALTKVYTNLKISDPSILFPMDGNDEYGDCTIAGLAHADTIYEGMIGRKKILTTKEVVKLYRHLTGGEDSGLNELDVLNYWQSNNVNGDKIMAFASTNHRNHLHVQQAMVLFGGVYLGFQVQENCMQDFNDGKVWTPGNLLQEGHAVYAVAYDTNTVTVLTWGTIQKGTWAWWDECVDEVYAILPAEAKQSDFNAGFNFAQLQADLLQVEN